MNNLIKNIIILILLSIGDASLAQRQQYAFTRYSIEEGLPSSKVYRSYQDKAGYLWFGTEAGLSRFDGYEFKNYTVKDGLPDNDVLAIQEDNLGRLWVTTLKTPCYLDRKADKFVVPNVLVNEKHSTPSTFCIDKKGNLWLLYNTEEIWKVQPDLKTSENLAKSLTKENNFKKSIYAFVSDFENFTYLVTSSFVWDMNEDKRYDIRHLHLDLIDSRYVEVSLIGHKILISYYDRVIQIDKNTGTSIRLKTNFESTFRDKFIRTRKGDHWAISPNLGFGTFQLKGDSLVVHFGGGKLGLLNHIMEDADQNVWISTLGDGILCLPSNATSINPVHLPTVEKNITSIFNTSTNDLIVGTANGSITIFRNDGRIETETILRLGNTINRVLAIDETTNGTHLFGSDKGIIFRSKKNDQLECFSQLGSIKSLVAIGNDSVLLTTNALVGLYALKDIATHRDFGSEYAIMQKRHYASIRSKDGTYWLGTTDGLRTSKNGKITDWGKKNKHYSYSIKRIIEDDKERIWLVTHGDGIVVFEKNNINQPYVLNTSNGFVADICNDLLLQNDTVWVATNRGLSRIINFDIQKKHQNIITLDKVDGLASSEVNKIALHQGRIYAATSLGLSYVQLSLLSDTKTVPKMYITAIKINEKLLPQQNNYQAQYGDNLEIRFVGISFESQKKLRYRFKMQGIDNEWQFTNALNVRYGSMPAGNYTFSIYAADKFGNENPTPAVFNIRVAPPFWQTIWFALFAITLVIIGFVAALRVLQTYSNKYELEKLVKTRTHELNENLEALRRSNQDLEQYAYIASHDLRTPLRAVMGLIQMLEDKAKTKFDDEEREFIKLSIDAAQRMNAIIEDLLTYARISKSAKNKNTTVNLDTILKKVKRDLLPLTNQKKAEIKVLGLLPTVQGVESQMFQLFQNLIENGIKYNDANEPIVEVNYTLSKEGTFFKFWVKDNGIGIEEAHKEKIFVMFQRLHQREAYSGTGIGLAICKKIVEEHGGTIWFESKVGQGTTFFFTIPNKI